MSSWRPSALLLDLDGTLVDSDAAVARSWERVCVEWGLDHDVVRQVHAGRTAATTIGLVAPGLDMAEVAKIAAVQLALQYDDLADVVSAPGALELLEAVTEAGLPWAVVTSGDYRLASARLAAADIVPPLLITAEDVNVAKPDPEGYLLAARRIGVAPPDCLVVEDAAAGVEAGRRAGMRVAGVRGAEADIAIGDLAELAAWLNLADR